MTTNDTPRTDACPHCGCQTKDPFGMGKTIHNVENCKRNRQLAELKGEVERLKEEYEAAAESVARMHEAAVGEIRGPSISVIDDIKAVRERAEKAEAEVDRLHAKNEKLSEDLNRADALVRQSDLMWRKSEAEVERLTGILKSLQKSPSVAWHRSHKVLLK